jgi:predicted DCC family thiol-disulfide oxidoreductase YuxK
MPTRGPFTIYYDAGCPFCIRAVKLFRAVLHLQHSTLLPAQSNPARHAEMRDRMSWVVIADDDEHLYGWRAVSVVVSESPIFRPLGRLLGSPSLLPIGERFYRWIERHRPMLSKLTNFLSDEPPKN